MNNILIGTSGYDYPEWKGVFYPMELKRQDFLSYYANVFNALELNFCFYSMPTADRMLNFFDRSEGKVQFSVKANRLLTHEVDKNWRTAAADFKAAISPLQQKDVLSSVLFQLPQSFHYTPENRIYLANLIQEFDGYPVVIEFRHREWIKPSVFQGLASRRASVAFCDMPDLKALPATDFSSKEATQFIGPNAYIRLHGRNADAWYCNDSSNNGSVRYDYEYSDEELAMFVPVIRAAIIEGRRPLVFFNNHPKGSGATNAATLQQMCKEILQK